MAVRADRAPDRQRVPLAVVRAADRSASASTCRRRPARRRPASRRGAAFAASPDLGTPPSRRRPSRRTGSIAALSAQICSLSHERRRRLLARRSTGGIQALLSPAAAADDVVGARHCDRLEALEGRVLAASRRSSPSGSRSTGASRWPTRSRRSHPASGPNATAGSPSETRPLSKYHGSVPIGPTSACTAGSVLPTTPWQSARRQPV